MKATHRPPHLYFDDTYYFITSGTFHKKAYFNSDEKKELITKALFHAVDTYSYLLLAWVILDNHYHLLIKTKRGILLPKFIGAIQGKSAIELNKLMHTPGRQRWYQYWDHCIRNEAGLWKHFNYIHHNPVKHGYVKDQNSVANFKFSSYKVWIEKKGKEWMDNCFAQCPIIDLTIAEDNY